MAERRRRPRPGARRAALAALRAAPAVLAAGCAAPAGPYRAPEPAAGDALLVEPGSGSLRQDDVTLTVRSGELVLKVTPLEEWVLRLTAPDTWDRLHEVARVHGPALARDAGVDDPTLFLVSFFSESPATPFEPEDVHVVHRGRTLRPLAMRGLTPGWGTGRLRQQEPQLAVYAYAPGVDFTMDVALEYRGRRDASWASIQRTLQAELARARARGP